MKRVHESVFDLDGANDGATGTAVLVTAWTAMLRPVSLDFSGRVRLGVTFSLDDARTVGQALIDAADAATRANASGDAL